MGWPTICRYLIDGTSGDDSKIPSADLVPCGSRMSVATPDSESVIWIRSLGRLKTVLACLAGISLAGYCRQSLSESSVRPMGRVGRRSNRFEDKSAYRDRPIYPNNFKSTVSAYLPNYLCEVFGTIFICSSSREG